MSTQPCPYLPATQRACPSPGQDQTGVGLWWSKWHKNKFLFDYVRLSLSVSSHKRSILIHQTTCYLMKPYQLTASLCNRLKQSLNCFYYFKHLRIQYCTVRGWNPGRGESSAPVQNGPGTCLVSYAMGIGSLAWG